MKLANVTAGLKPPGAIVGFPKADRELAYRLCCGLTSGGKSDLCSEIMQECTHLVLGDCIVPDVESQESGGFKIRSHSCVQSEFTVRNLLPWQGPPFLS